MWKADGMIDATDPTRHGRTSKRVTVVGDALIDELRDPHGSREFVGGAALNVAVGLALLGEDVALVAMLGDDEPGERIRAYLRDYDVRLVASPSPHGTSRAVSDRSEGGEPRYEFNEAAKRRAIRFDDETRAALDDADLVVVSCYPFDDDGQVRALMEAIARPGERLVVDGNPRSGMMADRERFLANFEDVAARSAEELDRLYAELADAFVAPKAVAAGCTPDGTTLCLNHARFHVSVDWESKGKTGHGQAVAITGRLSSSDPNLQNIPIRTAEGRRIRQAFVAPPGKVLLSADYSQIELRIMAHLSGDAGLARAFAEDGDIHRATAAEVFELPPEQVTSEQRRAAKAINFGLIYGMSAFGLARQLGIERQAAQEVVLRAGAAVQEEGIVAIAGNQEVEGELALRRQQRAGPGFAMPQRCASSGFSSSRRRKVCQSKPGTSFRSPH